MKRWVDQKSRIAGLVLVFIVVGVVNAAASEIPESAKHEPAQRLIVRVAGQEIEVKAGEPTKVHIDGAWVEFLVEPGPEKTFDSGVMSFDYLNEMAFAFDGTDPTISQWSLDGQDSIIMIQQLTDEVGVDEYGGILLDTLEQGYGPMFQKREPIEIELGGKMLAGERITFALAELSVVLTQDVYMYSHGEAGGSLILQDTLTDAGDHSPEFEAMVDRLSRSFRWADLGQP